MYANGIAIVAITRRGVETAQKIKDALQQRGLNAIVYAPCPLSSETLTVRWMRWLGLWLQA